MRGVQNYAGYCQRLVTRVLDQAQRILDSTRQAQVLNKADAQLAKDVPVIPLFDNPTVLAHKTPSGTFASPRNWIRSQAWRTGGSSAKRNPSVPFLEGHSVQPARPSFRSAKLAVTFTTSRKLSALSLR